MKRLKFYDLSGRRSFFTDKYVVRVRRGLRFAVATAPSGRPSWRVLGKR